MDKLSRIYVDVHVLQTVPPSCVNRDDTGSPKTAIYGGTTRARVSSQSWKRAMRLMFRENIEKELIGNRTKHVKDLLVKKINEKAPDKDPETLAKEVISKGKFPFDEKKDALKVLYFISEGQINALADLAISGSEITEDAIKTILNDFPSVDMALFGRMVAADSSLNYDAAAQVAHALSTHAVHNEYDYFTAVDDYETSDNAGAAHLDTVEFNSSTLYRYATVNVQELAENLGDKTIDTVTKFLEAFVYSMPTGKQNTFANRTLPDFVYVTVRKDQPINLVGAFEKAITSKEGYVEASIKALSEKAKSVYSDFVCPPESAFYCGKETDGLGEKASFGIILEKVENKVKSLLED